MPAAGDRFRRSLIRESASGLALLLFGLLLLPVAVYVIGGRVFGPYEGDGLGGFFAGLMGRLADGNGSAWFLVLSPLLLVLAVRALAWSWRALANTSR